MTPPRKRAGAKPAPSPADLADKALRDARTARDTPLPDPVDGGPALVTVDEHLEDLEDLEREADEQATAARTATEARTAHDEWREAEALAALEPDDELDDLTVTTPEYATAQDVRKVLAELRRRMPYPGGVNEDTVRAACRLDEDALAVLDRHDLDEGAALVLTPSWHKRATA